MEFEGISKARRRRAEERQSLKQMKERKKETKMDNIKHF